MTEMVRVPHVLRDLHAGQAVELVRQYFDTSLPGRHFSGAFFDRLDGGGDRPGVRNSFTGADVVALRLMSIDLPAGAADHLRERREELGGLLAQVPHDLDLVDAHPRYVDSSSFATDLWNRLTGIDGVDSRGASALLARKRPRLIPVGGDHLGDRAISPAMLWTGLQESLGRHDNALHRHLAQVRQDAGVGEDISVIRVYDIVCWMLAQLDEPRGTVTGRGRDA